jgi:hypothetical protein
MTAVAPLKVKLRPPAVSVPSATIPGTFCSKKNCCGSSANGVTRER